MNFSVVVPSDPLTDLLVYWAFTGRMWCTLNCLVLWVKVAHKSRSAGPDHKPLCLPRANIVWNYHSSNSPVISLFLHLVQLRLKVWEWDVSKRLSHKLAYIAHVWPPVVCLLSIWRNQLEEEPGNSHMASEEACSLQLRGTKYGLLCCAL